MLTSIIAFAFLFSIQAFVFFEFAERFGYAVHSNVLVTAVFS